MNKTLGFRLVVYGVLLAGLSYLTHSIAPTLARPVLITGLVGGALCVVWGVRAVLGQHGKAWPILTLVPVNFVMLSQTVFGWVRDRQQVSGQRMAAIVITMMFLCSIGMLMMIAYAGVTFDGRPTSPAPGPGAKPQVPGQDQSNAGKRA